MQSGLLENMLIGIIWYNDKKLRKNLQKIFDAIKNKLDTIFKDLENNDYEIFNIKN